MNFKEYKESLKFRKYGKFKIIIRFIEHKFKDFIIDLLIIFNFLKFKKKPAIDLGSFRDTRFINFLFFSLKDDFYFVYQKDKNTKKFLKRIGIINFFNHTFPSNKFKEEEKTKILINKKNIKKNEISIDTDYFSFFNNDNKTNLKNKLIMPYYMYPRIYNSFYKKINIIKKPNFNLRVFFSGSIVEEGYNSFYWKQDPKKFPNRIDVIKKVLKEFESEIFLINSKSDLKTSYYSKKKILLCLHNKMIKKTSYTLDFKDNLNLLNKSCFNLNCPGVVMPLCHHMIEGMKAGSIPITNCEKLVYPNLKKEFSLQYSTLDQLIEKIQEALIMPDDKVLYMRNKVFDYYKLNLSPESFKIKFLQMLSQSEKKIICCDDHRSVGNVIKN